MDYITAQEVAEKWGITRRRVQILCSQGRVNGAKKIANLWLIPSGETKPRDARLKIKNIDCKKEANNECKTPKKISSIYNIRR